MNTVEKLIYSHMHPIDRLTVSFSFTPTKGEPERLGITPNGAPMIEQAKLKARPVNQSLDQLSLWVQQQAILYFSRATLAHSTEQGVVEVSLDIINTYLRKMIAQNKRQGSVVANAVYGLRIDFCIDLLKPSYALKDKLKHKLEVYRSSEHSFVRAFCIPQQCPKGLTLYSGQKNVVLDPPKAGQVILCGSGKWTIQELIENIYNDYPNTAGVIILNEPSANLEHLLKFNRIKPSQLQ